MSRQFWQEALAWATADGTAVANTTTETIIFPNVTIPANYMQDGRFLIMRAFGKLSVTGTPTMIFSIRWGGVSGTVIAVTEAMTNGSGVTNVNWSIEAYLQVRSNGSSGTIIVMGDACINTNASASPTQVTGTFSVSGNDAPAATTCDLTVDTALALTAKWSAASASNTLTGVMYNLMAGN